MDSAGPDEQNRDHIMSFDMETAPVNEQSKNSNSPANAEPSTTHTMDIGSLGRDRRVRTLAEEDVCLEAKNLNLFYGEKQALFDVNMVIPRKRVTAFIGPSGCGKSTLLRTFNRMNDLVAGSRVEGELALAGKHNNE